MARVNTEERWWCEPRRMTLAFQVGGAALADGVAMNAWRMAQEFWGNDRGLIPFAKFKMLEHFKALLDVGLAEQRGEFVYICGSKALFEWHAARKDAARAGGAVKSAAKAEAARAREAGKRAQVEDHNQAQANTSKHEQPQATTSKGCQTQASGSGSDSDSGSEKENKNARAEQLERVYQGFPRKEGKARGLKIAMREIQSSADLSDLEQAIRAYREHCVRLRKEPKFMMHFATFMGEWRDWLDPAHGQPLTIVDQTNRAWS